MSTLSVQLEDVANATSSTTLEAQAFGSRRAIGYTDLELWIYSVASQLRHHLSCVAPRRQHPLSLRAPFGRIPLTPRTGRSWVAISPSRPARHRPASSGVAIYDLKDGTLTALSGNLSTAQSERCTLLVDTLYIGGDFSVSGSNVVGLAIYNLAQQTLDMTNLQPLGASSGAAVIVRSLTISAADSGKVVVAGSFATAGGSACAGICQLDTSSKQWSKLGPGILGEVASVAYGGGKFYY